LLEKYLNNIFTWDIFCGIQITRAEKRSNKN